MCEGETWKTGKSCSLAYSCGQPEMLPKSGSHVEVGRGRVSTVVPSVAFQKLRGIIRHQPVVTPSDTLGNHVKA